MKQSQLRRQITGSRLGLENFGGGEGGAGSAAVVDAVPEHETVAAQLLELNEAEGDLDAVEERKAIVEDSAASLESFIASLETIADGGGLSPDAAIMAGHAVDAILEPVDITSTEVMPSLESFGASGERRRSTQISIESLKEKLAQVWEYIKGLIAKARKFIKDWYLKVWDAAPRLKAKAAAIRAKAQDVTGSAEKDKIDIGGLASKLQIGTVIPAADAAVKAINDVATILFGGAYMTAAKAYAEGVEGAVKELKFESDEAFTASAEKLKAVKPISVAGLADEAIADSDKRFGKVGDGLKATKSAVLPGNKMVVYISATGEGGELRDYVERGLAKTQYQLADASEKAAEKPGSTEVATLDRAAIVKYAEAIETIAGMIEKHKLAYGETDKLKDGAVKAGDTASSNAKKAKDLNPANTAVAQASIRLLQNVGAVIDQPTQKFTSYVIATSQAILTLCEKSLAQYK